MGVLISACVMQIGMATTIDTLLLTAITTGLWISTCGLRCNCASAVAKSRTSACEELLHMHILCIKHNTGATVTSNAKLPAINTDDLILISSTTIGTTPYRNSTRMVTTDAIVKTVKSRIQRRRSFFPIFVEVDS